MKTMEGLTEWVVRLTVWYAVLVIVYQMARV